MKIKLTSVYVNDQAKALRFYTEVLGFAKKADFGQGAFRWLTVASPEEPEGMELQLALNDTPAASAYQAALFQQGQPAAMFFSDDVQADYERMTARGAEFTMPPTEVTGSKIAQLNDTCGNTIQVTQLLRWSEPTEHLAAPDLHRRDVQAHRKDDLRQRGDTIDGKALKALVRAAVALNVLD